MRSLFYYLIMKKKKLAISILAILLVAALVCSLTACLKIGMKPENIKSRLEKHGATVKTNLRSAPVIEGWKSGSSVNISNIIYAAYTPPAEESGDYNVTPEDPEETPEQELYVIYCGDKKSADWVEEQCKAYKDAEENADICTGWVVYRYEDDNVIMVGHYLLLAVARQY